MSKKKCAVVGMGSVGIAIAGALRAARAYSIRCYTYRNTGRRNIPRALQSLYAGRMSDETLGGNDVVILTVADGVLSEAARSLADYAEGNLRGRVVLHTSGAMTSAVLDPLRRRGVSCGSMHPLQTFPRGAAVSALSRACRDIFWGLEGDRRALAEAASIAGLLGGISFRIPADSKLLYHAACVMMSNHLIALMHAAGLMAQKAGMPAQTVPRAFMPLIGSTLGNVLRTSAVRALTGPVERGDSATIARHLMALRTFDPALCELYRVLAIGTVRIAQEKGSPGGKQADMLFDVLGREHCAGRLSHAHKTVQTRRRRSR